MLAYARKRGLDPDQIARTAGFSGDPREAAPDVPPVERRVPLEVVCAVWAALVAATGDPTIALEATSGLPREAYGVLMLVIGTAAQGRDGWRRAGRYMALWSDIARFELEEPRSAGEPARVAWQPPPLPPGPGVRAAREAGVANAWRHAGRMIGVERFPLLRVCFDHRAAGDAAPYERFFGAPVVFGAPRTQIEFDPQLLERPLAMPVDPAIDAYLVARALGLGVRTLRRRLADEQTTFARVLDDVRRESAARALSEGKLGVGEIALAVGFSEPGAFVRAFKRWTGTTPGAWRATHRAAT